ncbi:hypothetical protein MCOR27_003668 [Pyricularia oryzae]|uniref:LYR motif-containing protein Cup1-like N-terminal domain-containing protein n=1 Tax=Pyricularia grisea TaxID=148305 RepID=A0ABQ8NXZ1_PYRGI|nr:hypothetical protein MCOR01_003658 [Pyricularia oryzae]KAI6303693.1 hypothetical protein MCOR33_001215 [Pyricularia grisea]KAI6255030.1 hypothetical protein MCOR19_008470 [Pyricularia oryzae]KAI6266043.1 hypothetical protein MCOR26_010413 [Pyricularia oryzae]KAI6282622.1 hypothetical protein MCOR27_003668 [Pyricularia oryzae]
MPLQLPAPKTPLHLYRHLLREASYLPPVIRPCFTERIVSKFRQHQHDPEPTARIRKTTQRLRTMRAAVAGDLKSLEKVIQTGFGRTGFRRRQLLSDFLPREPPPDSTALQQFLDWKFGNGPPPAHLMKFRARSSQKMLPYDWLDSWDTDKLAALLKAQSQVPDLPNNNTVGARQLDVYRDVPKRSGFGRPFPGRTARTKVKKAWKILAEKLLPPVPEEEWNVLRDLAHGKDMARGQVLPRRPVAGLSEDINLELAKQSWDMENYLLQPARWVDRKSSRRRVLFTGIPQPNDELGFSPEGLSSKMTTRNMRRIYATVWRMTPFMEKKDAPGARWNVKFGQPNTLRNTDTSQTWHHVFQGVDQDGSPIKKARKTRSRVA